MRLPEGTGRVLSCKESTLRYSHTTLLKPPVLNLPWCELVNTPLHRCYRSEINPYLNMTSKAQNVARQWVSNWNQRDPSVFASAFKPTTGVYTDHAFMIHRSGHATLAKHFSIWIAAHPDFEMQIVRMDPEVSVTTQDKGKWKRVSIRTVNRGTFQNDLPRREASGKKFEFMGVVDLVIDEEDGLVGKVDEWYTWEFDRVGEQGEKAYNTVATED